MTICILWRSSSPLFSPGEQSVSLLSCFSSINSIYQDFDDVVCHCQCQKVSWMCASHKNSIFKYCPVIVNKFFKDFFLFKIYFCVHSDGKYISRVIGSKMHKKNLFFLLTKCKKCLYRTIEGSLFSVCVNK